MTPESLRKFFKTPKGLAILVLGALLVVAATHAGWRIAGPEVVGAAFAAMIVDAPILRWKKGRWAFPDGAMLTGMIVGMVLSAHEPWPIAAVTAAVGIVSKYLIRSRKANVFNPAALALVATFYLFDTGQSWWGALPDLPPTALVILIGTGLFVADHLRKMPGVLAFLGCYYALVTGNAFLGDARHVAELYRAPDLHAALFFAFFMVTDPPTSPAKGPDQIVYGAITAIAAYAAFELVGAAYFLLAGLLVANVWEAWRRNRAATSRQEARAISR